MKQQTHTTSAIYYSRLAPIIYALLNPALFLFLFYNDFFADRTYCN